MESDEEYEARKRSSEGMWDLWTLSTGTTVDARSMLVPRNHAGYVIDAEETVIGSDLSDQFHQQVAVENPAGERVRLTLAEKQEVADRVCAVWQAWAKEPAKLP